MSTGRSYLLKDAQLTKLQFDNKTLIGGFKQPWAMILQLAQQLPQALERPTRQHWFFPAVVQLANCFIYFAKGDFQSELSNTAKTSQPSVSRNLISN